MRVELPEFKRCCFCMPLRRGIIVWAYANLVFQALFLYIGVHLLVLMVAWVELIGIGNIVLEICGLLLILNSCVYSVLIIVASHKKSAKLLRISYIYGIVQWILSIAFSVCVLYSELSYVPQRQRFLAEGPPATSTVIIDMVTLLAAEFIQILIQGYMILMLRTETRKLREQRLEIEFVNNAAESEARCVSVSAHCSQDNDDVDNEENEARCVSVSAHCSPDNDDVDSEENEARCFSVSAH